MALYLNVLTDTNQLENVSLDSVATLLEEAGLELEVSNYRLSWFLFRTAKELRRTVGITGAPLDPCGPICIVGPQSMRDKDRVKICLVSPCPECESSEGGNCMACTI